MFRTKLSKRLGLGTDCHTFFTFESSTTFQGEEKIDPEENARLLEKAKEFLSDMSTDSNKVGTYLLKYLAHWIFYIMCSI